MVHAVSPLRHPFEPVRPATAAGLGQRHRVTERAGQSNAVIARVSRAIQDIRV